jgi:hypothetical protein
VGRFNDRTESGKDAIQNNGEGKAVDTDDLLLLQATVQTILILIKKLSDYCMTDRESSTHDGEGKDCLPAMLELRLQLLALPYSLPLSTPLSTPHSLPSDEHKDVDIAHKPQSNPTQNLPSSSFSTFFSTSFSSQSAEVSDLLAVKGALRAFSQFLRMSDTAVLTAPTSTSVPTCFSTSVPVPSSTCAFSSVSHLETLQKYLKIVQIAQSTLAHLLLILTQQHLPPPLGGFYRSSDGPTPAEKTITMGRKEKDKNLVKKSLGSQPVQALNKGQVHEREEVWYSLMIFCSNLQCIACTSSFLYFANHIPVFPPLSPTATAAAAVGIECGIYEEDLIAHNCSSSRCISPSPSSIISLLIVVASQRAKAVALSHRSGGSKSSNNNNNCPDLRIVEELWSAVTYILGHNQRNPLSPLSPDEMSYFLGRILVRWYWFQVPTEIFETRTLDLCMPDSTSESEMSQQGGLVAGALRQLLLRWRKRPPLHCVCGQPEHVDGGLFQPVTYFHRSCTDSDLCQCCQVYSKSSAVGEIDRRQTGPDWLLAVQKITFSSRFLIKIML